jgi:concanavalin A-like lectin/glucanase superfamily protein/uncharacterized protein DUF2341
VGKHLSREDRFNIPDLVTSAAWALIALAAAGAADAAENYSAWGRSGDLILDTSPAGADVQGAVADFPILVRLNAANFAFAEARGQGQDIRFSDPDGSPLAYQIERWDSTKALAEIWVRIGSIAGATAGQAYRMHWGNPGAADSSNGPAVFAGQLAVWHLGGTGSAVRPNSASATDKPAQPFNYDGDRSREGIIGKADELDGVDDYLDIGDGYQDPASGFSFSVWAYPKSAGNFARFFDIGNGQNTDNLVLTREGSSDILRFDNFNSGALSSVRVDAAISPDQWQLFAVNISGSAVRIFKNGGLVAQGTLSNAMANVQRTSNFLGRSNLSGFPTFQGLLDESAYSRTSRSDDWYKLCYRNQKADQKLVTLKISASCVARFQAPADTILDEGSMVNLAGIADCAAGVSWIALSGPAPRILDPETRTLAIGIPRVAGDTAIVYRFTATYGDSAPYRDIRVRIREAIPEPAFTLPAGVAWNGRDSMAFRPVIANLAAIKASRDSALHWSWTLAGPETDTAWLKDGLMLKSGAVEGSLEVGLCLDNSGAVVCRTAVVTLSRTSAPVSSIPIRNAGNGAGSMAGKTAAMQARGFRDAAGRLRTGTPSNLFGTPARPGR